MDDINEMLKSSTRGEDLANKANCEVLYLSDDGQGDLGYLIPVISRVFISEYDEESGTAYAWDDFSDGAFAIDPSRVYLTRSDLHEALMSAGENDADIIDEEVSAGDSAFAAHARGTNGRHAVAGCSLADALAHCDGLLCSVYDDAEAEAFIPVFFDDETQSWRCVASGYDREVEGDRGESHIVVAAGDYEHAVDWMMERFEKFLA